MSEDTIDYKKLAEALAEALEQRNLWIEGEEYRELVILRMRLSKKVESLAEELEAANARIAELEEFKMIVEGCGFEVITEPPVLNHPERKILKGHGIIYVPELPEPPEVK